MITQVRYLPKDENVSGPNPVQVTFDNGQFSVFQYDETHFLYESIQRWIDNGNTILPAE